MRKSREEAAETRKRIVQAAARQFRAKGIVATGLAELMKAAGLTHGGFTSTSRRRTNSSRRPPPRLWTLCSRRWPLTRPLSPPCRRICRPATGTTQPPAVRSPRSGMNSPGPAKRRARRQRRAFMRLVDTLAWDACNAAARRRALVAAATMIGAVTMSRLVTDAKLSAEILFAAEKSLAADQP